MWYPLNSKKPEGKHLIHGFQEKLVQQPSNYLI